MRSVAAPGVALLALGALAVGACSHHLYSPPVRSQPLDSPAVIDPGQNAASLAGAVYSAIFGPDVITESAQLRRGLRGRAEGVAELRLGQVLGDSAANTNRTLGSGRFGVKWNPPRLERYLGLTAGAGWGLSAAGGFLGADAGLVAGFENPYVVPLLALQLHASLPVGARRVDTSQADEPAGTRVDSPRFTWGHEITLGFKVRLQPRRWLNSAAVSAGLSFLSLYSTDAAGQGTHEHFTGLGLALEVPL